MYKGKGVRTETLQEKRIGNDVLPGFNERYRTEDLHTVDKGGEGTVERTDGFRIQQVQAVSPEKGGGSHSAVLRGAFLIVGRRKEALGDEFQKLALDVDIPAVDSADGTQDIDESGDEIIVRGKIERLAGTSADLVETFAGDVALGERGFGELTHTAVK